MEYLKSKRVETKGELSLVTKNTYSQIIFVLDDIEHGAFLPNYYNTNRKKYAYQNLKEAVLNTGRLAIITCFGHSLGLLHPGFLAFPGTFVLFGILNLSNKSNPLKFQFHSLNDRSFYNRSSQQGPSSPTKVSDQSWWGEE